MKFNKGMTLTSLIIYVIVFTIAIGTVSSLTKYFYKNSNELTISVGSAEQYSRFVEYMSEDINSGQISDVTLDGTSNVKFAIKDGSFHEYSFSNNKIFYKVYTPNNQRNFTKYITLCKEIAECTFTYENSTLTTMLKIGETVYKNNFQI